MNSSTIDPYLQQHATRFEDELCDWLRMASVSADAAYQKDVRRAADWIAGQFQTMGLKTQTHETAGHPIVYAESPAIPGAPTVLVYGHYDVQPPDPLNLWTTPAFEPTRRDGNIYARGATDDKGQVFTHVKSAEAWLKSVGQLPIQLKFLIEGEEEVGSHNLEPFIDAHRELLKADVVVVSDTSQFAKGQPAITYGLRGIVGFELRLTGPKRDLHSGTFGGAVANPANALVRLLSALHNDRGEVQVPGFYDDVEPISAREKAEFERLAFREADFCAQVGVRELFGESGYSTLERRWTRPTCDINGLTSGYQGEGSKTVLPSTASAKLTFRLVPKQDPAKIGAALEAMLRKLCPPGITLELLHRGGAPGVVVPLDSPFVAAAAAAIEQGFGKSPVYIREGGSIPVVATFKKSLGIDTLLLGWGLDDDNTHSPNEKFCLADFHRGIKASAHLWGKLGQLPRP